VVDIQVHALHPDPRDEGPGWPGLAHEVKHDGFRLIVQRDGDRVRRFTRNGHDWSDGYPWIVDAARRLRQKQFVIDGEAMVLGVDGISAFAALYSRKHDEEVQFYAFDMLVGDGDDMRSLPLSIRKANLAWLLSRRSDGIFIAQFELGKIGPDLFRAVCGTGLEGLVSKHRDRPYRAGRSPHWLKVRIRRRPRWCGQAKSVGRENRRSTLGTVRQVTAFRVQSIPRS
jgi:bifunctional non-homologous end joining protein LigD